MSTDTQKHYAPCLSCDGRGYHRICGGAEHVTCSTCSGKMRHRVYHSRQEVRQHLSEMAATLEEKGYDTFEYTDFPDYRRALRQLLESYETGDDVELVRWEPGADRLGVLSEVTNREVWLTTHDGERFGVRFEYVRNMRLSK